MEGNSLSLLTQKEADFESDMERHLYQFLLDKKYFLIVEGAVIHVVVKVLSKLNDVNLNEFNNNSIAKYLGADCQIDLLGQKLSETSTTESCKNLLVCHIIQAEQVDLSNMEKAIIPKLKGESKKLIIVSPKNMFNNLKKLDCGKFLLIDEFNRKVHVDQYWTLYQSITFGFMEQLGKPENSFNVNEPLYVTNEFLIHKAIREGHINIIYFLLACGASLHCEDKKGRDPFELALKKGNDNDVMNALLYKLNSTEWYEFLHRAIKSGKIQYLKLLLQRNFDLNEDKTLLHQSVKNGHLDIVKLLLQKGANVDHLDSDENSPLHIAVIHNHLQIVKYLVSQNAEINLKNMEKKTPLDLSKKYPLVNQYLLRVYNFVECT
ncbi:unnamed protein product [Ceutorhynchus assimilis]|uniref:Uncharacterized protein n=1 Tax=Ceutorhynchus assimilis TaxID=467358 RepID=A0A9N9MLF8_9CUCU|nr:unnamed protein product [Ceutorhynchus assimilis]